LGIGLVLQAEAGRFPPQQLYSVFYAYVTAALLVVALAMLGRALFSTSARRPRSVLRATLWVVITSFFMTAGYALVSEAAGWSFLLPSANQIAASVVLDLGGGALAALIPAISYALLRRHLEVIAETPPSQSFPPNVNSQPVPPALP